jgi:hypothetical protein
MLDSYRTTPRELLERRPFMKLPILVAALIASVAIVAPAAAAAKKSKKAVSRPSISKVQGRGAADPSAVYVSGEYIGRDPDPNIRAYMMKNPHDWDGPN